MVIIHQKNFTLITVQSAKILLLPSKREIIFVTLWRFEFFQYCDRNIGLFSIAPHLVIALPTMSLVDLSMASFLYCFPYSYRSSNYCDSNSCRSFTLLKALAKSNGNLFAIAFKGEKEWKPSKKKQRIDTKKGAKRIKSDNFTRSNREKIF